LIERIEINQDVLKRLVNN